MTKKGTQLFRLLTLTEMTLIMLTIMKVYMKRLRLTWKWTTMKKKTIWRIQLEIKNRQ